MGFLTRDAMAEALSLEGRTLHTLRDLLWRPARLLDGYRSGVASDYYFSPFKLLLVMTGVMFLFLSWTDVALYQFLPVRTGGPIAVAPLPDGVKVTGVEYADVFFTPRREDVRMPELEAKLDAFSASATPVQRQAVGEFRKYNLAWIGLNDFFADWIPRVVWLLMPVYAGLLAWFFHRRPFAEHMLFAVWAHSAAGALFIGLSAVSLTGLNLSVLIFPLFLALFVMAARGFYRVSWVQAGLRGAGHLGVYSLVALLILLGVAWLYARQAGITMEMWLGDTYTYVDGGAEVRVPIRTGAAARP
jgi:hypothetical protein